MTEWSSILSNRIVSVCCVFAVLGSIHPLLYILSRIQSGARHGARGSCSFEHSLSTVRTRNFVSSVLFIPFCLVCDRFRIWNPGFADSLSPGVSLPVSAAAILLAFLFRNLLYDILRPYATGSDEFRAAKFSILNYFIVLVVLLLPFLGILSAFHIGDGTIKSLLTCLSALIWLLWLIRCVQILSLKHYFLSTILYLCVLEILPVAILVASDSVL